MCIRDRTYTILVFSSKTKAGYFKSNPRSNNQIPKRHPNPHMSNPIPRTSRILNPKSINALYQEHIQYIMLRAKYHVQVNITWGELQFYSWPIGYTTTRFGFIYSPGIMQENVLGTYSYITYQFALRAMCAIYRKHSSSTCLLYTSPSPRD